MVDFLNDDIVFEGEVITHGELVSQGGLTIGPGGLRVGQPASELTNSWPAHLRARVADVAERTALTSWRKFHAPITPAQPLAVWRADGSSTGVEEITTDGINWYMESPAAGDIEMTLSEVASYGWVLMQGQTIANAASLYPALWAAASPALRSGQDLRIPDMRGRSPMGAGTGPGLTWRNLGDLIGAETATINEAQLPQHGHAGTTNGSDRDLNHNHWVRFAHEAGTEISGGGNTYEVHSDTAGAYHLTSTVSQPSSPYTGVNLDHLHSFNTNGGNGQGQGHANVQPSTIVNFKLKV